MGKISDLLNDPEEVNKVTKEAFEAVDTDKSGFVDENELSILMTKVASDCSCDSPKKNDVKNALKAIDTNKDGKISLEEFKVLVVEILKALAANEESLDEQDNN